MSEIRDFVAKAERFLQSAQHLFEIEDYDSCVSRAYYSMFFLAEAVLMTRGICPASHRGVITLFGKHLVQTGVFPPELGRALNRAYDARLMSDYATGLTVSREEAENLLQEAKGFVAQVRAYLERQEGKTP